MKKLFAYLTILLMTFFVVSCEKEPLIEEQEKPPGKSALKSTGDFPYLFDGSLEGVFSATNYGVASYDSGDSHLSDGTGSARLTCSTGSGWMRVEMGPQAENTGEILWKFWIKCSVNTTLYWFVIGGGPGGSSLQHSLESSVSLSANTWTYVETDVRPTIANLVDNYGWDWDEDYRLEIASPQGRIYKIDEVDISTKTETPVINGPDRVRPLVYNSFWVSGEGTYYDQHNWRVTGGVFQNPAPYNGDSEFIALAGIYMTIECQVKNNEDDEWSDWGSKVVFRQWKP